MNQTTPAARTRVIVITGGTSGIGQAAAEALARTGARCVIVARDRARARATLDGLHAIAPEAHHSVHYADLSVLAEIRRVAGEIADAEPRIDVLINNAGSVFPHRELTVDGLEKTFALNHMSYFGLAEGLQQNMTRGARIVNTASEAHRAARFDADNLQWDTGYGPLKAYGLSKLCNILFTRELARRLADTGITVNCLHPGVVNTRLFETHPGLLGFVSRWFIRLGRTPEKGAETVVYLATSDAVRGTTGLYFSDCRPKNPTRRAQSEDAARQLWDESVRLYASSGG